MPTKIRQAAGKSLFDQARVTGFIEPVKGENWDIDTIVADTHRSGSIGSVMRTGRGVIKEGETYTRLIKKHRWTDNDGAEIVNRNVMMSDTPDEIRDMLPLFYAPPRGRILVNGLGLGCAVKALLSLDEVEHIDIVEIDAEVIELIGPYFEDDERVVIHHADAFEIQWPTGTRWDVIWHDIWLNLSEENLPEMTKLHRRYGNRCGQQFSWGRDFIERNRY